MLYIYTYWRISSITANVSFLQICELRNRRNYHKRICFYVILIFNRYNRFDGRILCGSVLGNTCFSAVLSYGIILALGKLRYISVLYELYASCILPTWSPCVQGLICTQADFSLLRLHCSFLALCKTGSTLKYCAVLRNALMFVLLGRIRSLRNVPIFSTARSDRIIQYHCVLSLSHLASIPIVISGCVAFVERCQGVSTSIKVPF